MWNMNPKRHLPIVLFSSILLVAGASAFCDPVDPPASSSGQASLSVRHVLFALIVRSHNDDPSAEKRIYKIIAAQRKPEVLQGIAEWSRVRMLSHQHDIQCRICDRYEGAFESSLWRLGRIGGDEAGRRLVALLQDTRMHWDGHPSEIIVGAITTVGKPALPYLEALPKKGVLAEACIDAIRAGKVLD